MISAVTLGAQVEPFDRTSADAAAGMYPGTTEFGLSLGDRACLTLAMLRKVPTLTADQTWARIPDLGVDVVLIR